MEFFSSVHIETLKDIHINKVIDDLVYILEKEGYQIIGNIGTTEIKHKKGKKHSRTAHDA